MDFSIDGGHLNVGSNLRFAYQHLYYWDRVSLNYDLLCFFRILRLTYMYIYFTFNSTV